MDKDLLIYSKINVLDGVLFVVRDKIGFTYIGTPSEDEENVKTLFKDAIYKENDPLFIALEKDFSAYFKGEKETLDVPVHLTGTPFQISVWQILEQIPYGKTWSYLDVAKALGAPHKVRAVANAIGQNKLFVRIPCHRVIGSDGKMRGFGGGVSLKIQLLKLEKAI